MMFHTIDYIILAVIGLSVLTGLFRGFAKECIALAVWIVAIWAAYTYAALVSGWLQPYIDDPAVRMAVGFVLILLIILLLGAIFNAILSFILHRTGLSGTDRLLGMLFGFVRGIFIVALVIVVLNMTSLVKSEDYVNRSFLYVKFDPLVRWLSSMMPSFIKQASLFERENFSQEAPKNQALNPK